MSFSTARWISSRACTMATGINWRKTGCTHIGRSRIERRSSAPHDTTNRGIAEPAPAGRIILLCGSSSWRLSQNRLGRPSVGLVDGVACPRRWVLSGRLGPARSRLLETGTEALRKADCDSCRALWIVREAISSATASGRKNGRLPVLRQQADGSRAGRCCAEGSRPDRRRHANAGCPGCRRASSRLPMRSSLQGRPPTSRQDGALPHL